MRHWIVIAGVIVGVAVSVAVYAQQKNGKLTPQDYAEIQQLYARYAWSVDNRAENGMVYARMFVPDGAFASGDVKAVGHKQLAEMIMKAGGPETRPSHYTLNIVIEPSPDGARGGAYLIGPSRVVDGKPATANSTGTYEDTLVRTPNGWRFKTRTLRSNAMSPALTTLGAPSSSN